MPLVQEFEHRRTCNETVKRVWLEVPAADRAQLEEAQEVVRRAVAQLPIGASRRDFEQARDAALVPIRNAVATRQEQEMRVGLMQHVEFRFAGWPDDLRKQASAAMRDAINGKPAGTQWKRSTRKENEGRIGYHLTSVFAPRSLRSFSRDELQGLLDRKAALSLSFSVVDHLRWDLNQIFGMAVVEGYLQRNPAALLFTPRECPRATTRVMTVEEVRMHLSVLGVRERLIAKLGVLAGMRPGEIFALTWGRLEAEYADIRQRVYRGGMDSPKSVRSTRWAALSDGLLDSIEEWKKLSLRTGGYSLQRG